MAHCKALTGSAVKGLTNDSAVHRTTEPVDTAGCVFATALTALSVGVVNVADLSVPLEVDTTAVIPVVATDVFGVVCDSVVGITLVVVVSMTHRDTHFQYYHIIFESTSKCNSFPSVTAY